MLKNTEKRDFVAFFVCADGIIKGDLPGKFSIAAHEHEQFIVDTPGSIGCQPAAFFKVIGIHCFDETDDADRDHFICFFAGVHIFFDNMCHKTEIPFDENIPCVHIAILILSEINGFLRSREGLWE